jgi:hypothetical protein
MLRCSLLLIAVVVLQITVVLVKYPKEVLQASSQVHNSHSLYLLLSSK